MKKTIISILVILAIVTAPFFLVAGFLVPSASAVVASDDCSSSGSSSLTSLDLEEESIDSSHVSWSTASEVQKKNAKIIRDSVEEHNGDAKHLLVTVMVAIAESEMQALDYGDSDSLGMFQQRANWGPADKRKDAKWSTDRFLTEDTDGSLHNGTLGYLDKEKDGQITATDPWMIAQQVQASAFSDGSNYKKVMGNAQDIIKHLDDVDSSSSSSCSSSGSSAASSGKDDYPYKDRCNASTEDLIQEATQFGGWICQCVDFVSFRVNKAMGWKEGETVKFTGAGNANQWESALSSRSGWTVNDTPRVGAVAIWNTGTYGHVAMVSKVEEDGKTIEVEQYNFSNSQTGNKPLRYSKVKGKIDNSDGAWGSGGAVSSFAYYEGD
ncbi:MAG: CHAP domain-containing protein [Micrococcaceae bacterium]